VEQISVRCVDLDDVQSKPRGSLGRRGESLADGR
jgi:hypothetical protein